MRGSVKKNWELNESRGPTSEGAGAGHTASRSKGRLKKTRPSKRNQTPPSTVSSAATFLLLGRRRRRRRRRREEEGGRSVFRSPKFRVKGAVSETPLLLIWQLVVGRRRLRPCKSPGTALRGASVKKNERDGKSWPIKKKGKTNLNGLMSQRFHYYLFDFFALFFLTKKKSFIAFLIVFLFSKGDFFSHRNGRCGCEPGRLSAVFHTVAFTAALTEEKHKHGFSSMTSISDIQWITKQSTDSLSMYPREQLSQRMSHFSIYGLIITLHILKVRSYFLNSMSFVFYRTSEENGKKYAFQKTKKR